METYVADLVDMEADKNQFFLELMKEEFLEYSEPDWSIDFDDYAQ